MEDLRRIDAQMSQTKKKLAAAVKASGTTLTEIFGVGPVIAAIVLAEVQDVSRFPAQRACWRHARAGIGVPSRTKAPAGRDG